MSHSSEAGCSRARAQLKPYLVVGSGSVVRVSGQGQRPESGLAPPKPYDSSQLMPPPPPAGSDAPRRARTASVCLSVRCMHELPGLPELPVLAAEVVVTEGLKARRGSVATLETISPALGVLVFSEEFVARRAFLSGAGEAEAVAGVERFRGNLLDLAAGSRQRIHVWSARQLKQFRRLGAIPGHLSEAVAP